MNGAALPIQENLEETIFNFLKEALDKDCVQAVIIPHRVPSGDSFAYLIIRDKAILENASPLPPIIPVQGAKAISSLTRNGTNEKTILAVMHPCEIRAAVELAKLQQADLSHLVFLSFDCPGVLPLSTYLEDPETHEQTFQKAFQDWDSQPMRPVCRTCTEVNTPACDLHIGHLGAEQGQISLIPFSPEGERIIKEFGLALESPLERWGKGINELQEKREEAKKTSFQELESRVKGPEKLSETFSSCINCHNCMRVCPVCYCRQCYFESEALKLPPENFLTRAERKGSLRLPPETLFFHLGRMSHMILSCVSCGTCEDACPMNIPIAQVFSLVADKTQKTFEYRPGLDKQQPLPAVGYREEEFEQVEKPYSETYPQMEGENV
jgi:formate dehydrogenase subunit beta